MAVYCKCEKTEIVVFGGIDRNSIFMWKGTSIKVMEGYKYLGMIMKRNLNWKDMKAAAIIKARRKIMSVFGIKGMVDGMDIKTKEKLWVTLIRSSLEYGVEVWDPGVWPEAEQLQYEIGRRILRGKKNTTKEVILGELGWWRLVGRRDYKVLMFWRKIMENSKNGLIVDLYRMTRAMIEEGRRGSFWVERVRKLCQELGLENEWKSELLGTEKEWREKVWRKIQEREEMVWLQNMDKKPKLFLYKLLKNTLRKERYLEDSFNNEGTRLLTQLRSGTSDLRLETGRFEGLERKNRLCLLCLEEVENENHFMCNCKICEDERKKMYNDLEVVSGIKVYSYNADDRLRVLIGVGIEWSKDIYVRSMNVVKRYIQSAMRIRKGMLSLALDRGDDIIYT